MKRGEYLETRLGQKRARRKRLLSRQRIAFDNHQPKNKNGIILEEKIAFQQKLLEELKKKKRKAYVSSIALELTFYSNLPNPPALQTMAKNYLDLLETSVDCAKVPRYRLLYKNDRQVKILTARYEPIPIGETPRIKMVADRFSNVLADLELIEKIKNDDFPLSDDTYSHYKYPKNYDNYEALDRYRDELEDLIRDKKQSIQLYGEEAYTIMYSYALRRYQQEYLKFRSMGFEIIKGLLLQASSSFPDLVYLNQQYRTSLLSPYLTMDFGSLPQREGESKEFKQRVKDVLEAFRVKHPYLFPLQALLGITIVCLPPEGKGIDLDNLGLNIIPFVHEKLEPPPTHLHTINFDSLQDSYQKEYLLKAKSDLGRIPKHSITHYEIIELPRLPNDPKNGYVRLILNPGNERSILTKIDNIINEWEDGLD